MNQNNNSLNNIFKSGMFTSTPQKDTTPSPFGTNTQNNTNVFGSQQPFGSSNIFQSGGQAQPMQNNSPFGTQNVFGSNQGSYFSAPKPQGSVFGALGSSGTVQPLQSVQQPTQTSSVFGSQTPTGWGTPSTSIFGSSKPSYTTPTFGTTSFQSPANALSIGSLKNGTRDTPYQDTRVKDGIGTIDIKHINAMNDYARKSNDELRHEDYNLGRKAITSGTQSSTNGFRSFGFGSQPAAPTPVQQTSSFTPSFGTSGTSSNTINQTQPSFTSSFQTSTNPFVSSNLSQQAPTNNALPNNAPTNNPQTNFTSTNNAQTSFTPTSLAQFPSQNPFSNTSSNPATAPSSNTMAPAFPTPSNTPQPTFGNVSNPFSTQPVGSTTSANPFLQQSNPPLNTSFLSNNTTNMSSMFGNTTNFGQSTQPVYNQTHLQTTCVMQPVNYEDPFLLKDIKFEQVQKKTIPFTRAIPKPIFTENVKKPLINLKYRPPRPTQKKKIYTEPSIEEARHLKEIDNLVIGFDGKGRIQYLDKINGSEITSTNIEDKITFMKNEVIVSDPPGLGLNKRARVYVEGIFAFSKSQGDFIVGKAEKLPLKAIQERFVYSLKEDPYKKFIDYNYETGLYVYEVNHF